jgi:hypothetical protein
MYLQLIQKFPGISEKSKSQCHFYTRTPLVMCRRNPLNTIPSCSFNVELRSLSQRNCEELFALSYQSVCLSVRMQESDSHQIEFHEISCVEFLLVFVDSFRFYFRWDKNKGRYMKTCLCIRSPVVYGFTFIIYDVLYEVCDDIERHF